MPSNRILTDTQCRALAQWADALDQLGREAVGLKKALKQRRRK